MQFYKINELLIYNMCMRLLGLLEEITVIPIEKTKTILENIH